VRLSTSLAVAAVVVVALVCAPPAASARAADKPLTVAAAISLKDVLTETATRYEADGGPKVQFTFGSSGQLAAQVRGGAPVDVFISAAHAQLDELAALNRIDAGSRRVVAGNRLVLIVPASRDERQSPAGLKQLSDPKYRRVAIGEPRTVPAGHYAQQALRAVGVAEALEGRVVHGANVRQVLDYVRRGEVDAGIVYETDAREAGDRVRVAARVDPATHDSVEYPAAALSGSRAPAAARRFVDYLGSDAARAAFAARGFTVPARRAAAP
jgi:molybdate transport system substrate-binding protein